MKTFVKIFTTGILSISALVSMADTKQWAGLGVTQALSDPNNWASFPNYPDSTGASTGDILYFEDLLYTTGYTDSALLINNIVDTNISVGSVNYTAVSIGTSTPPTNHLYTTSIPAGNTLTVGGLAGAPSAALAVGDVPGSGAWINLSLSGYTNYTGIVGAGTLNVNDTSSLISVGWKNRATLDLSNLNTFTANVKQVWVGVSSDNPNPGSSGPVGYLLLARTNNITTAMSPGILLGHDTNGNAGGFIQLGAVNNFNTDGLVVGGRKSTQGSLMFGPVFSNSVIPSSFTLRGAAGGSTPAVIFSISDAQANWDGFTTNFPGTPTASSAGTTTADFSGGVVDIMADAIYVGRSPGTNAATNLTSGGANGTLIAEQGTINAGNVYIGYKEGIVTNAAASGTVILRSNAVMNVANNVSLVYRTNGTGFINLSYILVSNNAALNVGGNLVTTNAGENNWTVPAVVVAGGTVNMTNGGQIYVPQVMGYGTVANAGNIIVTNAFAPGYTSVSGPMFSSTHLIPGTFNVGSNLTLGSAVSPVFCLGSSTNIGGGVNDFVNVSNNVTFSNNPLAVTFIAAPAAGTYTLLKFGGTQTGSVTWTNPTRLPIGLEQGVTNRIAIIVTNATLSNDLWQATGATATWDTATANWNGNASKFFAMDNVTFDDTGVATNVTVSGTVKPSSVTFNNSAKKYTLQTGSIGGYPGLTLNGTNFVVLTMTSANNTFTGPVNINAGILQIGGFNSGMLGDATANTPINIAPGGMLDLNGNSVGSTGSFGRALNFSGTGVGGLGAVVHNKSSSSSSLATQNVALTNDGALGCTFSGVQMALVGYIAPYFYTFDLGGHTLTTVGAGGVRINQYTMTNSGSINVGGAYLGVLSSIIDGPGTIRLGNNYLNFYSSFTTGYVAKTISVTNGGISATTANAAIIPLRSPVSIATGGSLSITNSQPMIASGVISGNNAALYKYGNSNLVLSAANSYTGPTWVAAGTLSLSNSGSLASTLITVTNGAVLDVTGVAGGTYALASGQTLNLIGNAQGSFSAPAGSVLNSYGSVSGSVSVGAGGTLSLGNASVAATMTITSNLTFSGGTNIFKLASTTPGAGYSDLVIVSNLSFTAPTTLRIVPIAGLNGSYTLYQYSGTLSGVGNISVSYDGRNSVSIDTLSVPGSVLLVVGAGGNLTWQGGAPSAPTAWDIKTTTNWLNGGTNDFFWLADSVTFDDSGLTNTVNLTTLITASAVTMNNSGTSYGFGGTGKLSAGSLTMAGGGNLTFSNGSDTFLGGSGLALNAGVLTFNQPSNATLTSQISGSGGLTKSGTNVLTVVSVNSTGFNGAVSLNGGTLRPGSSNAFGSATITAVPGTTFDLNGQISKAAAISTGGVGVDGLGAINNRGAVQSNALDNVTLTADTIFGATSNRWDITPVDTNGTAGTFVGNGYNLTKLGANDIWVRPMTDLGVSNISIGAGRVIFGGAGTSLGITNGNLVVSNAATLGFANNVNAGIKNATLQNGSRIYSTGPSSPGATNEFDGPIVMTNLVISTDPNITLNLGGNVSGTNLTFQGVAVGNFGALNLNGSNSFGGTLTMTEGQLTFYGSNSMPSALTNLTLSSRVNYNVSGAPYLQLGANVTSPTNATLVMRTSSPYTGGACIATLAGDGGTWTGPLILADDGFGDVYAQSTASFNATTNGLVLAGPITTTGFIGNSSGNGGVKINGDSVLCSDPALGSNGVRFNKSLSFNGTFSSANYGLGGDPAMSKVLLAATNFWTNMFWARGVIQIATNNALPRTPITIGTLVAGGDHRVVLDLNGYSQTIASWTETFVGNDPVWFGNNSTNSNALLQYSGTGTNTWSAFIVDALNTNASVQKTTSLNVTSGYLKLVAIPSFWYDTMDANSPYSSGAPPYQTNTAFTGATSVTGGTFEVDRALGTSPVTVSGAGTLAGTNGVFSGPVVIMAGGTISPGSGSTFGTLTVSNTLTLGGTSRFKINLTTGTNDQIACSNTLTYGGTILITNIGAQIITNGTVLPLFSASSYVPNTVTVLPTAPAYGLRWDTTKLAVDGTLRVAVVNTNSVRLTLGTSTGNITLSWPADYLGWRLQSQTNGLGVGLTTNWFTVAGSTNVTSVDIPVALSNGSVYFRLVYP